MTGKLKGKFNPDDLTPRRNLPDKSVIAPGKGIGDDVVELPYKPKKSDGSKYEPGKKSKFSPKEGEDYTLLRKGGHIMKRKMRKFEMGGPTSYADSGSAGSSFDDLSFSEAFRLKKRELGEGETFTWRGKKYKTDTKKKSDTPSRVTKTETTTEVEAPASSGARSGGRGSKPGSVKVGTGRYDDPTSSYMDRVLSPFKRLTGGNLFGQREVERVARGAGVGTEEARRRIREAGMYRGGSIKKMAGGGMARSSASRRADGIAKKGKTRGRIV